MSSRLRESLTILNKIGPHWNAVKSKGKLVANNDKITTVVRNDINVDPMKGLNIFLGGYNDIDDVNVGYNLNDEIVNKATKSLVIYPDMFSKLPANKQRKVATFLAKWRSNFNKLCANAANTICNAIEEINKRTDIAEIKKQLGGNITRNINSKDLAANITNGYLNIVNEYAANVRKSNISDKITWCLNSYIPIVNAVNAELSSNQHINNGNRLKYQQLSTMNPSLNIIPVIDSYDSQQTNGQLYMQAATAATPQTSAAATPKIIYKDRIIEKPGETKIVYKDRIITEPGETKVVYRYRPRSHKHNHRALSGGAADNYAEQDIFDKREINKDYKNSSTYNYKEEVNKKQIEFNGKLETLYKTYVNEIGNVQVPSTMKISMENVNNCIEAIKGTAIGSVKTSYKISGLYNGCNWSKYYVVVCEKAAQTLTELGGGIFNNVISIIRQLKELSQKYSAIAKELLRNYMITSKYTSEMLYDFKNVAKIPCNIPKEVFAQLEVNLKALAMKFANISNETNVYSIKNLLERYVAHVDERAAVIVNYINDLNNHYAVVGPSSNKFTHKIQMNEQIKTCLLYLNKELDPMLAKLNEISKNRFDKDIYEKFEKAMIAFKDVSTNSSLIKAMEKIHVALFEQTKDGTPATRNRDRHVLELLKYVQKLWKTSGYIDFIIQLYQELGIIDNGFNFAEFKANMALLLSLVNIDISTRYEFSFNITRFTKAPGAAPTAAETLDVNTFVTKDGPIANVFDLVTSTDIITFVEKIHVICDSTFVDDAAAATTSPHVMIPPRKALLINTLQQALNAARTDDDITIQLIYDNQDNTNIRNGNNYIINSIHLNNKRYNLTLIDKHNNTNNSLNTLADLVLVAMLGPIGDKLKAFTEVKYTGNYSIDNIPMYGGAANSIGANGANRGIAFSMQGGGNIMDILAARSEDYKESDFIDDAVPLYIITLTILIFYSSRYGEDVENGVADDQNRLFFAIPKISPLYPVYDRIVTSGITAITAVDITTLRVAVKVCSDYWKQAQGSNSGEKLNYAVDMILNEVNASMIFTNRFSYNTIKATGVSNKQTFTQSLASGVDKFVNCLSKVMVEAFTSSSLALSNEQRIDTFESYLHNAYAKIAKASATDKMNELMKFLTSTETTMESRAEVMKFFDFGLMPLVVASLAACRKFDIFSNCIISCGANDLVPTLGTPAGLTPDNHVLRNDKVAYIDLTKTYMLPIKADPRNRLSVWQKIQFILKNYDSADHALATEATAYKIELNTRRFIYVDDGTAGVNYPMLQIYKMVPTAPPTFRQVYPTLPEYVNSIHMNDEVFDAIEFGKRINISKNCWFIDYLATYPKQPIIQTRYDHNLDISDNVRLALYQLYPTVRGQTLYDYFTVALSEFSNDIDKAARVMLAYPNVNNKFIKTLHNNIKTIIDNKLQIKERFSLTDETINVMKRIKMNVPLRFVHPPPYISSYSVPQFIESNKSLYSVSVYDSIDFVNTASDVGSVLVSVDGYGQRMLLRLGDTSIQKKSSEITAYSWTDWAIATIANCSNNGTIPYKLASMLAGQHAIARRIKLLTYSTTNKNYPVFDYDASGMLCNPLTGYIITRSLSDANQQATKDSATIDKQQVGNICGIMPYMINKMRAYYKNIDPEIYYADINVKTELNVLINSFIIFHNDFANYCPKISFMDDMVTYDGVSVYHPIENAVPQLTDTGFFRSGAFVPSTIHSGNVYNYGHISELIFTTYKGFDPFARHKDFAKNIFANSLYSTAFDDVIPVIYHSTEVAMIVGDTISSSNLMSAVDKRDLMAQIMYILTRTAVMPIDLVVTFVNNYLDLAKAGIIKQSVTNEDILSTFHGLIKGLPTTPYALFGGNNGATHNNMYGGAAGKDYNYGVVGVRGVVDPTDPAYVRPVTMASAELFGVENVRTPDNSIHKIKLALASKDNKFVAVDLLLFGLVNSKKFLTASISINNLTKTFKDFIGADTQRDVLVKMYKYLGDNKDSIYKFTQTSTEEQATVPAKDYEEAYVKFKDGRKQYVMDEDMFATYNESFLTRVVGTDDGHGNVTATEAQIVLNSEVSDLIVVSTAGVLTTDSLQALINQIEYYNAKHPKEPIVIDGNKGITDYLEYIQQTGNFDGTPKEEIVKVMSKACKNPNVYNNNPYLADLLKQFTTSASVNILKTTTSSSGFSSSSSSSSSSHAHKSTRTRTRTRTHSTHSTHSTTPPPDPAKVKALNTVIAYQQAFDKNVIKQLKELIEYYKDYIAVGPTKYTGPIADYNTKHGAFASGAITIYGVPCIVPVSVYATTGNVIASGYTKTGSYIAIDPSKSSLTIAEATTIATYVNDYTTFIAKTAIKGDALLENAITTEKVEIDRGDGTKYNGTIMNYLVDEAAAINTNMANILGAMHAIDKSHSGTKYTDADVDGYYKPIYNAVYPVAEYFNLQAFVPIHVSSALPGTAAPFGGVFEHKFNAIPDISAIPTIAAWKAGGKIDLTKTIQLVDPARLTKDTTTGAETATFYKEDLENIKTIFAEYLDNIFTIDATEAGNYEATALTLLDTSYAATFGTIVRNIVATDLSKIASKPGSGGGGTGDVLTDPIAGSETDFEKDFDATILAKTTAITLTDFKCSTNMEFLDKFTNYYNAVSDVFEDFTAPTHGMTLSKVAGNLLAKILDLSNAIKASTTYADTLAICKGLTFETEKDIGLFTKYIREVFDKSTTHAEKKARNDLITYWQEITKSNDKLAFMTFIAIILMLKFDQTDIYNGIDECMLNNDEANAVNLLNFLTDVRQIFKEMTDYDTMVASKKFDANTAFIGGNRYILQYPRIVNYRPAKSSRRMYGGYNKYLRKNMRGGGRDDGISEEELAKLLATINDVVKYTAPSFIAETNRIVNLAENNTSNVPKTINTRNSANSMYLIEEGSKAAPITNKDIEEGKIVAPLFNGDSTKLQSTLSGVTFANAKTKSSIIITETTDESDGYYYEEDEEEDEGYDAGFDIVVMDDAETMDASKATTATIDASKEREELRKKLAAAEEAKRLAAEKAAAEEAKRLAAEKAKREEAERLAAEKAKREEAERLAAEKAKREEAERKTGETTKTKVEILEAEIKEKLPTNYDAIVAKATAECNTIDVSSLKVKYIENRNNYFTEPEANSVAKYTYKLIWFLLEERIAKEIPIETPKTTSSSKNIDFGVNPFRNTMLNRIFKRIQAIATNTALEANQKYAKIYNEYDADENAINTIIDFVNKDTKTYSAEVKLLTAFKAELAKMPKTITNDSVSFDANTLVDAIKKMPIATTNLGVVFIDDAEIKDLLVKDSIKSLFTVTTTKEDSAATSTDLDTMYVIFLIFATYLLKVQPVDTTVDKIVNTVITKVSNNYKSSMPADITKENLKILQSKVASELTAIVEKEDVRGDKSQISAILLGYFKAFYNIITAISPTEKHGMLGGLYDGHGYDLSKMTEAEINKILNDLIEKLTGVTFTVPITKYNIIETYITVLGTFAPLLFGGAVAAGSMPSFNPFSSLSNIIFFTSYANSFASTDKIWNNSENAPNKIGFRLINTLFDSIMAASTSFKNSGFAYNVLSGGAESSPSMYTDVIASMRRFIPDPWAVTAMMSPTETYNEIFKLYAKDDDDRYHNFGSIVYRNIFKYANFENMGTETLFALTMNYFRKHSVSFNSIYNQVLFPSIIYNAASFRSYIEEYAAALFDVSTADNNFTQFINSMFKVVLYCKQHDVPFSSIFDLIYKNDENYADPDVQRSTNQSYQDLTRVCNAIVASFGAGNFTNCDGLKLANVPSVNNSFIKALFNNKLLKVNTGNTLFNNSTLVGSIKSIDFTITLTFLILLISKYYSYYNIDTETDVPYTSSVPQNPFDYNI